MSSFPISWTKRCASGCISGTGRKDKISTLVSRKDHTEPSLSTDKSTTNRGVHYPIIVALRAANLHVVSLPCCCYSDSPSHPPSIRPPNPSTHRPEDSRDYSQLFQAKINLTGRGESGNHQLLGYPERAMRMPVLHALLLLCIGVCPTIRQIGDLVSTPFFFLYLSLCGRRLTRPVDEVTHMRSAVPWPIRKTYEKRRSRYLTGRMAPMTWHHGKRPLGAGCGMLPTVPQWRACESDILELRLMNNMIKFKNICTGHSGDV